MNYISQKFIRRSKKRIALFICLATIIFILPLTAFAEGFTYEFKEGQPHSKSLLMLNLDTNTVAFSHNPDEKLPMASLTKIMTYIVAYEFIPDLPTKLITVPQSVEDDLSDTYSSLSGVNVGEQLTGQQLLNLMMVPSGNDAALVFAKYFDSLNIKRGEVMEKLRENRFTTEIPNSTDDEKTSEPPKEESSDADSSQDQGNPDDPITFVEVMNLKAQALGCENTSFVNPHGLHDPNHYSTSRDMMTITKYATTVPDFISITGQIYYTLPPTNISLEDRTLPTTNKMMVQSEEYYYTYTTGIKTGSLNESGYCLASSATFENFTYLIIALGSPMQDSDGNPIDAHGEMLDSSELYRWAFRNLEMKTIAATGDLMGDVKLKYAWNKDKLQVVAGENISAILPSSIEKSSIIVKADLPDVVEAPVKKGEVVGKAILTYADKEIGTVPIIASESVERSELMMTFEQSKSVFTSKWFLLIVGVIAFMIIIYIILMIINRKRRGSEKTVRRYRDL